MCTSKRNLADITKVGRYVGRSYSDSLCTILDERTNRLFHNSRNVVFVDVDFTEGNTSVEPPTDINDDSFIEHCVSKPEPSIDHLSEDESVQLEAHAAWYDGEAHEIESALNIYTPKFPT